MEKKKTSASSNVPSEWECVSQTNHADCKIFRILKKEFRHPDGRHGDFYIQEINDWIQVAAFVNDGGKKKIVMVNQFRFGEQKRSWEFAGGVIDKGESPLEAAKRELWEETGYTGKRAKVIACFSPNPAIMNNKSYVVVIEDCKKTDTTHWDDNEEIQTKLVDVNRLDGMVASGKIYHSIAISSLYFIKKYLANKKART